MDKHVTNPKHQHTRVCCAPSLVSDDCVQGSARSCSRMTAVLLLAIYMHVGTTSTRDVSLTANDFWQVIFESDQTGSCESGPDTDLQCISAQLRNRLDRCNSYPSPTHTRPDHPSIPN